MKSIRLVSLTLILLIILAACQEEPAPVPTSTPAVAAEPAATATAASSEEASPTEPPPTNTPEPTEVAVVEEPTPETAVLPETINLALLAPLTGSAEAIGQAQLQFVEGMVTLFNERTGLDVTLLPTDSQLSPEIGVTLAEQLGADETVFAVVGPTGFEVCAATQSTFAAANLVQVTPSCTADFLTDPGTATFFRPIPAESTQSSTLSEFITEQLGATAVYLIDDQSSYGLEIANQMFEQLNEAGLETVLRGSITDPALMPELIEDVFRNDVTAVLYAALDLNLLSEMATALQTAEFSGAYLMTDSGFVLDPTINAENALEGAYTTFFAPVPSQLGSFEPLLAQTSPLGDNLLDAYGAAAAQATAVTLAAIESCATNGDLTRLCIANTLATQAVEETPFGETIAFNTSNEWQDGHFFIYQLQNGSLELIVTP